ncbi:diacylglycerol kinase family protein [Micromonospora arborensis]|uniref:diacylglycerol/lipid kinase family protein n=1 Tax=Micromonospora arborensis TaxID=2116518 RepID=UPI00342DE661
MSTSATAVAPPETVTRPGRVAVVAHRRKNLGGGLDELRATLAAAGVEDVLWYEVSKSRKARKKVSKALKKDAELVFVWGGDGMVQRCADTLAGTGTPMAILPAGTANLLAANVDIPENLAEAVRIGLCGRRRRLDLGRLNGEHFAVMAGAGFDGDLIREADRELKGRLGRLAYVWTGLRHVRGELTHTRIRVDGVTWFDGEASCVLFGNVGTITGGIPAFDDARPDDGCLEVGVSTASGAIDWARALGRMAVGRSTDSPFIRITRGHRVTVRLDVPRTYELDGGARAATRKLKVRSVPGALTVCCPESAA